MIDFEDTVMLQELIRKYPGRVLDYLNSCNETQWSSKTWLVEELNLYLYKHGKREGRFRIVVLGGWYGLLSHILTEDLGVDIEKIVSVDIDPIASKIGSIFCPDIVKFETNDIIETDLHYDILINTSTEHMEQGIINHTIDSAELGTIFVLQSNNFFDLEEHINCSESKEQFDDLYHWHFDQYVSFTKPWPANLGKHERYMAFGIKK